MRYGKDLVFPDSVFLKIVLWASSMRCWTDFEHVIVCIENWMSIRLMLNPSSAL